MPLSDDEFRLLAFLRGYADRCDQHLDPAWIQEQLGWSIPQMQQVARGLATLGHIEFLEMELPDALLRLHPELGPSPMPSDIRLTIQGWNYLRRDG